MERFAKKFRVMGSIWILLELVTLFLPFMKRVQENYPEDIWSRLDYIQGAIGIFIGNVRADLPQTFTTTQAAWILGLMALPLVIAVAACVWGIVGDHKQRVSSILIFLVFLLDIIMFATKGNFLLQGEEGQSYLGKWKYVCTDHFRSQFRILRAGMDRNAEDCQRNIG